VTAGAELKPSPAGEGYMALAGPRSEGPGNVEGQAPLAATPPLPPPPAEAAPRKPKVAAEPKKFGPAIFRQIDRGSF
jgi:hypothetical protein